MVETPAQLLPTVKVIAPSHPKYGEEGVIDAQPPNNWQQIVLFPNGERLVIKTEDLDASSVPFPSSLKLVVDNTSSAERTYPKEYAEALAQLKQQHKEELERLENELRIGLLAEATAQAELQVKEQLESLQKLFHEQKHENIKLQQRINELKGLKRLESENAQLLGRIQELENAVEQRPAQEWGNTFNKQATKVLNQQVKAALENTIDLRCLRRAEPSLAIEPPKENVDECLQLMGLALKNLAAAMNNSIALQAATLILGGEGISEANADYSQQLALLPQAIAQIREVLSKPGCNWLDFWAVAEKYQPIKKHYWVELTKDETQLIIALKKAFDEAAAVPDSLIRVGSIVAYADPYFTLYNARGEVIEDFGEEVLVAWDHWKEDGRKFARYGKDELRVLE